MHPGKTDALKDQQQLGIGNDDSFFMNITGCKLIGALLQALVVNAKAIFFPGQDLYACSPFVKENKDVSGQQVLMQFIRYYAAKTIKGLQHINVSLIDKVSGIGIKGEHKAPIAETSKRRPLWIGKSEGGFLPE